MVSSFACQRPQTPQKLVSRVFHLIQCQVQCILKKCILYICVYSLAFKRLILGWTRTMLVINLSALLPGELLLLVTVTSKVQALTNVNQRNIFSLRKQVNWLKILFKNGKYVRLGSLFDKRNFCYWLCVHLWKYNCFNCKNLNDKSHELNIRILPAKKKKKKRLRLYNSNNVWLSMPLENIFFLQV